MSGSLKDKILCRCEVSGEKFEVSNSEADYLQMRGFPLPRLSPSERQRRRLSFRNQRHLYRRKCSATGKPIISMYSPDYPGPVVTQEYWFGDGWDPLEFGREIDFTKPFFPQFHSLFLSVPQPSTMVTLSENCEYNAYCARSKDCYLSQSVAECENVYYTFAPMQSRDCLDCHNVSNNCELCYEVLFGSNCYDVRFSKNVANCRESSFLYNCRNCSNCFFCSNLRNAEYYFGNEKLDRESYKAKVAQFLDMSYEDKVRLTKQFLEFQSTEISPALWGTNNENVTGNQIFHSKNVMYGFDIHESEDVAYSTRCFGNKTCRDCNNVFIGEELYEVTSAFSSTRTSFSFSTYEGVSDTEYSGAVCYSSDLFGCVGIRRRNNCILNIQYTKDEYRNLREKLIHHMKETGEWGEFFPVRISPFPFNDTVAQDFFPLAKEEAVRRGYRWRDSVTEEHPVSRNTIKLPERSSEADESICENVCSCERCGKGYKIQKKELQLILKLRAPLPHKCFECRYSERMDQLELMQLKSCPCASCGIVIETCYMSQAGSAVEVRQLLCEDCYAQAVN